jgi:hypothetical protein
MSYIEFNETREVKFRRLEGEYFVCDFEWQKAKKVKKIVNVNGKNEIKNVTYHPVEKEAKIKLDINNQQLKEKAILLKKGDIISICYRISAWVDEYDISKWKIIDILDEIDLLEISNKHALIKCQVPMKESLIQPKQRKFSKNDRIEELEEENRKLKLEIENLKKA